MRLVINRPVVVSRGWDGEYEDNQIHAYVGEWAVFKLPMGNGVFGELRFPVDEAFEDGILIEEESFIFTPDEEEEESLGDSD